MPESTTTEHVTPLIPQPRPERDDGGTGGNNDIWRKSPSKEKSNINPSEPKPPTKL